MTEEIYTNINAENNPCKFYHVLRQKVLDEGHKNEYIKWYKALMTAMSKFSKKKATGDDLVWMGIKDLEPETTLCSCLVATM